MIIVFPYKNGSKSVAALKEAGFGVEIKRENSRFKGARNKPVVNWGASRLPDEVAKCRILNKPEAVAIAGNKLSFFTQMARTGNEQLCVPFTTDRAIASEWSLNGKDVVARTVLNGHSGEGIRILPAGNRVDVEAPLYTQYIPKKQEYRVHVFQGRVIDIQRKARKRDVADADVNWKIRNLDGGFIYARDFAPEDLPIGIEHIAIATVAAVGMDFGAVDIIFNQNQQRCYVLEVNTAPGLQGSTLDAYVRALTETGFIYEV